MHRRNLKNNKTWHVTCKVQWDLNGSITAKRIAASVASLQDKKLPLQNFIVSGFNSGCITFSFTLFAIFFLSPLLPLFFFFFFFLNKIIPTSLAWIIWLWLVSHNNYPFSCDFPSFQTSYQCNISKPSTNESPPFNPAIPHLQMGESWHFAVGVHCLGAAISIKRSIPLPTLCILRIFQATVIFHHYHVGDNSWHYSTRHHWIHSAHGRRTSQQKYARYKPKSRHSHVITVLLCGNRCNSVHVSDSSYHLWKPLLWFWADLSQVIAVLISVVWMNIVSNLYHKENG